MTTNHNAAAIVAAADTITVSYADALAPLMEIAAHTVTDPPSIAAGLDAVLHLTAAQPQLDHAVTALYRELLAAGVPAATLARLLAMRTKALTDRLDVPAPGEVTVPTAEPGSYKLRDVMSVRASRETLISAAGDLGDAYADALRPLSVVSQGTLPEAATVDAAVEAAMHLRRARQGLQHAVDGMLAALVLGGVKKMALAELLGINPATLQRRLMQHPLAAARGCDLVTDGAGGWTVQRQAVGRYAAKPRYVEVDEAMITAAVADAVR